MADSETAQPAPRLSSLAHGGGCGCKLAPDVLQSILAGMPASRAFPNLLVGTETSDDAAVYRLSGDQALVATTDFFTPVVDDARDFGRIAATNALSDVYAMGGTPILALAIVGYPVDKLPVEQVREILAGGASVCAEVGIPVAGGHSIDSAEPIYGLVALGLVHPDRLKRNRDAQAGDSVILTKGLGIGVFSAALKQNRLDADGYKTMVASATQLNRIGPALAEMPGVHAMTDVTGFGLLGHLLEMCRGSGLRASLSAREVPLLPGAEALARAGIGTGAARRNWSSYGQEVQPSDDVEPWWPGLLADPQTSGGLLIAAAPSAVGAVMDALWRGGYARASVVGRLAEGVPGISVEA